MTPGREIPVMVAELFDPATNTWTPVATQNRERTYHNSAVLMRDGRVLVGGHAPITNIVHVRRLNLGEPFSPDQGRDPSFEIYSPWYVFRNDRPVITGVEHDVAHEWRAVHGHRARGVVNLHSIVLMRRTAHTHLVDGDQRAVELKRAEHESAEPARINARRAELERAAARQVRAVREHQGASDGVVPSKGMAMTVGASVVGACH